MEHLKYVEEGERWKLSGGQWRPKVFCWSLAARVACPQPSSEQLGHLAGAQRAIKPPCGGSVLCNFPHFPEVSRDFHTYFAPSGTRCALLTRQNMFASVIQLGKDEVSLSLSTLATFHTSLSGRKSVNKLHLFGKLKRDLDRNTCNTIASSLSSPSFSPFLLSFMVCSIRL